MSHQRPFHRTVRRQLRVDEGRRQLDRRHLGNDIRKRNFNFEQSDDQTD